MFLESEESELLIYLKIMFLCNKLDIYDKALFNQLRTAFENVRPQLLQGKDHEYFALRCDSNTERKIVL